MQFTMYVVFDSEGEQILPPQKYASLEYQLF